MSEGTFSDVAVHFCEYLDRNLMAFIHVRDVKLRLTDLENLVILSLLMRYHAIIPTQQAYSNLIQFD